MALPLVYLGVAALAGWITAACRSEEKIPEEQVHTGEVQISAEPPPRKKPLELAVKKDDPAYAVFLQLQEAGLTLDQMEKTPDGYVREEELYHAGMTFHRPDLSDEKNKNWREKIAETFRATSDRFLLKASELYGITPPKSCEGEDLFKRAVLWNYNNDRAQMILGICQNDPKRIQHALKVNPDFPEAKQALEKIYREATEKNPSDAKAWDNLGDALKMQSKIKEAEVCYLKARQL